MPCAPPQSSAVVQEFAFVTVSDCESEPCDEKRGRKQVGFHDQVEVAVLSYDPKQSLNGGAKHTLAEACFRRRKRHWLSSVDFLVWSCYLVVRVSQVQKNEVSLRGHPTQMD